MSIIIHFGPSPLLTPGAIPPAPACIVETETTLEMGPGLDHDPDVAVMSEDDHSLVALASSDIIQNCPVKDIKTPSSCQIGYTSCFGLPYQDHNYGAPPPPTPPNCSPHSSPIRVNGIVDEDTSFSVISTTSTNNEEETHEGSITRCVCGYEHDDEYMICCDQCLVWQHVDCMGLDRNNIPETYMCEKCEPRKVDKQKAKALQARKKVAMTDTTSDDSVEEESSNQNLGKTRNKTMKQKRKERKYDCKNEHIIFKKIKVETKPNKERTEMKSSRLRSRTKTKSDGTSTADEEAQDAWESSLDLFDKYEEATVNLYSSEIQILVSTLQRQSDEHIITEQFQANLCKVAEISASQKRLLAVCDLSGDQLLIEYKGKFLSVTQFQQQRPVFSKRQFPFVLFYNLSNIEFCVDATEYGNDARFIRRSCKPNAKVKHVILNGKLHLYIFSSKEIGKDEEITIPFDFNYKECIGEIECTCEDESCCIMSLNKKNGIRDTSADRKKRGKRVAILVEDDSSQSLTSEINSPIKSSKGTPVKNSAYPLHQVTIPVTSTTLIENIDSKVPSDEQEVDEQITEKRKKMTREERKIDAIMRAFEQMEKAAKRRQQALERLAHQKAQQKPDDNQDQIEGTLISREEERQNNLSNAEIFCGDEEKPVPVAVTALTTPQILKQKKGKRRRGSGTPARRRMRTNSGGSDILSPDETLALGNILQNQTSAPITCGLPLVTSGTPVVPLASSPGLPATTVIPKTKRFLMHEWLQEKVESSIPISCPLSIHTELSWNFTTAAPTCYVRCTRDNPSTGGISAAHLRRSSSSSGHVKQTSNLESAKKRWLKQAMYECGTCEMELSVAEGNSTECILHSPLHNGYLSPNSHSDMSSPCVSPPEEAITPLKKRRLIRESLESLHSPQSPSTPSISIANDWLASASSGASPDHSCSGSTLDETFPPASLGVKHLNLELENSECTKSMKSDSRNELAESCKGNGLETHLINAARELKDEWLRKDKMSELESSVSSSCIKSEHTELIMKDNTDIHSSSLLLEHNSESISNTNPESSTDLACLELSDRTSSENELKRTKIEPEKHDLVSVGVVSNSISELSDAYSSDEVCSISFLDKTNLSVHDCDAPFPQEEETSSVKILSTSLKDDTAQEPSSTTVDCVSSSSSVNDININSVPCSSSLLVQAHVSSSCTSSGDSISKDVPKPVTGLAAASSKLCDLQCKSVLPETSQINITSSVSSSAALNSSVITSTPDVVFQPSSTSVVSSTAIPYSEPNIVVEESNNQNFSGVSSTVIVTVPSSDDVTNNASSSSVVTSSGVTCSHFNRAVAENQQANISSSNVGSTKNELYATQVTSLTSCSVTCSSSLSATVKSCVTAQKRKVSLSEYRMRMREYASNDSKRSKKNTPFCIAESSEVNNEQIKMSPTLGCVHDSQNSELLANKIESDKDKKEADSSGEEINIIDASGENLVQRENLTQRLKREFGFDDDDSDSELKRDGHHQKSSMSTLLQVAQNIVPILSLCTQPPPPPPPLTSSTASPPQYSYPVAQPYSQQPYVVTQVAPPYIAAPPPLTPQGVLPVLHHMNSSLTATASSHPVRPLVQQAHPYSTTLHAAVQRTSQVAYTPVMNTQNFAALVQQPPPPPPPQQAYPSLYKPRLYK